ncbi:hydroxymyristoyl-ACP dehydratase [Christiangramia salexigens]|uniref:Hydroxymyristoyl-ACP dehydratase n=1 Tax=Christiangramia salexigens TaxID=1913577 RepID=A0A1L3J302_9FLAO|nr:hydroxymyristoyl-ACP dehydratase [Christiangramia salexigens]APG59512.1 hydroxymyristoyl-ACP dehydratase [Christiangramia salexigens]
MVLKNFYEVIDTKIEDDKHCTTLKVNAEHEIFNGHFPGRPVTPGVVLMQLFKDEAERISKNQLQFVRGNNIKFTAVFDPTDCNELLLESNLEEAGDFFNLKGIAKNNNGIVLKISSLYHKL